MKDPVEFQLPRGNLVFIAFCEQMARNWVTPALSDDFLLDIRDGSVMKRIVSELSRERIIGLTHVVS